MECLLEGSLFDCCLPGLVLTVSLIAISGFFGCGKCSDPGRADCTSGAAACGTCRSELKYLSMSGSIALSSSYKEA